MKSFRHLAQNEDCWQIMIHSQDANPLDSKAVSRSIFCGASARPSWCIGVRSQRSCNASFSIPQACWGTYCKRSHWEVKSRASYMATRTKWRPQMARPWTSQPQDRLPSDGGGPVFRGGDERKERHVSGIPAVHGSVTNTALGIATLPERQMSRRHFVFSPAIGTFEDYHSFHTVRQRLSVFERGLLSLASPQSTQTCVRQGCRESDIVRQQRSLSAWGIVGSIHERAKDMGRWLSSPSWKQSPDVMR